MPDARHPATLSTLLQRLCLAISRAYASLLIIAGGTLYRSNFRALEGIHTTIEGFSVAGPSQESIAEIAAALECLRVGSPRAYGVVKRWLHSIGVGYASSKFRAHACEGTVLLRRRRWQPASILAGFLYRLALEVMIAKRFHRPEVLLTWRTEMLIGLRAELRLVRQLGAPEHLLDEHQDSIAIYKRKRMRQKRRTQRS